MVNAFLDAQRRLDRTTILGGEILWSEATPHFVKSSIDWETVARTDKPCGLALRVAPFAGPFEQTASFISATARTLLIEAKAHGAAISAFELDFDCGQKRLARYQVWLRALRPAVGPLPLSITVLPSWLDEPAFAALLNEVDRFVLQVHSVPTRAGEYAELCDPRLAKKWAAKAGHFHRPFSIALPTYRCIGGYDSDGKLLGTAMDGVQPSWPSGTRVLEFAANADELAELVAGWQRARPSTLHEIIWYRVPTEMDLRNWRWPTLAAIMAGRAPTRNFSAISEGENPVDLLLVNAGESDEPIASTITASWEEATLLAADVLPGWSMKIEQKRAVFTSTPEGRLRLSPGERRGIGWLRYDRSTQPQLEVAETQAITR